MCGGRLERSDETGCFLEVAERQLEAISPIHQLGESLESVSTENSVVQGIVCEQHERTPLRQFCQARRSICFESWNEDPGRPGRFVGTRHTISGRPDMDHRALHG